VNPFQAPTGTRDVLAPESARFALLVARFSKRAHTAGYGLVISPMFEDAGVFNRSIGEQSEVVSKEMYEFEDKGGRRLALRPEGTASVVRAFVQHRPQIPWKAWYVTPAFRYERPQAGRYRQHHQLGVEVIGTEDPDLDVETIALLDGYLRDVGLRSLDLSVNSMGDPNCRPRYESLLVEFLARNSSLLCEEHGRIWSMNPLRVLDCKRTECVALRESAPRLRDSLCEPCARHFERVLAGLEALGIAYQRDDFLVRGFDYYTRTTFEITSGVLDSAQNAVGGGGRYDGLVERLGGPAMAGIGFGSGIERVLLAGEAEGLFDEHESPIAVFVVDVTGGGHARNLTHLLREEGIASDRAFDDRSMKAQLRQADRSGARIALIVGADEAERNVITVKMLRGAQSQHQEQISQEELVARLRELLS